LFKAEDLKTSLDILLQLAFFKDADTFIQHKRQCDIYILPDLEGHSTGSFAAADSILDIGKKYGRLYYPRFKKLADSLKAIYPDAVPVNDRLPKTKVLRIRSYSVDGLKNTTPDFFFGLLGLKENAEFFSEKLAESIRVAYGSRYYKLINYDFVTDASGGTDLRFKVIESELTAVKLAINYNTFTKLSLIANMTTRDLLLKESRALGSVAISENPRVYLEYHKYLGARRKFGFNVSYFREIIDYPVYEDFDLSETLRNSAYATDFRAQYSVNRNSYVALHQQFNSSRLRTVESPDLTFKAKDRFYQSFASYEYNNVDKKYFTTNGWRVKAEIGYVYGQRLDYTLIEENTSTPLDTTLFDTHDYGRVFLKLDHYKAINTKFVFMQNVIFGLMNSKHAFSTTEFQVGGIGENLLNQVSFYGLSDAEIKTESVASAQLGLQYKLAKSMYLTARANLAIYDFHNLTFEDLSANKNILSGYAIAFGFDSAIGPIEITSMYCDQDGSFRTNLNLGFRFLKQ
jgi:NTE family protein